MMKRYKQCSALLAISLSLVGIFPAKSYAQPMQPLDEIRTAATTFVENRLADSPYKTKITAGYLDPRLRLSKCANGLQTKSLQKNSQNPNTTVVVSCEAPKPWTIYVPVKVNRITQVVVSRMPLARNQPIRLENLKLEEKDVSRLNNGYYSELNVLKGKLPKRAIASGAVISPSDLGNEKVINRGQRVSIIAESNGFNVRMPGKALHDASRGERVQVENLSSKRKVEGIAISPGLIQVQM